jgi:hypothetical protein
LEDTPYAYCPETGAHFSDPILILDNCEEVVFTPTSLQAFGFDPNYVWRIRNKTGWTTWPQMVSWYNAMYGSEAGRSTPLSGRT